MGIGVSMLVIGKKLQGLNSLFGKHKQTVRGDFSSVLDTEELGALDQVFDFSPIEFHAGQLVEVGFADVKLVPVKTAQEIPPDASAGFWGQGDVRKEEIDAGLEGVVDLGEAVGCEEEDSLVVFELGKED